MWSRPAILATNKRKQKPEAPKLGLTEPTDSQLQQWQLRILHHRGVAASVTLDLAPDAPSEAAVADLRSLLVGSYVGLPETVAEKFVDALEEKGMNTRDLLTFLDDDHDSYTWAIDGVRWVHTEKLENTQTNLGIKQPSDKGRSPLLWPCFQYVMLLSYHGCLLTYGCLLQTGCLIQTDVTCLKRHSHGS